MTNKTAIYIQLSIALFLIISLFYTNFKLIGINEGGFLLHGGFTELLLSSSIIIFNIINKGILRMKDVLWIFYFWSFAFNFNEFLQLFNEKRVFDWFDILNQEIGLMVGLFLVWLIKKY